MTKPKIRTTEEKLAVALKALRYYANRKSWGTMSEGIVSADYCGYWQPINDRDLQDGGPWDSAMRAIRIIEAS